MVTAPERWYDQCVQQGGELPLWQAVGSYHVWLIADRVNNPHLHGGDRSTSVPQDDRAEGKRLLRRLGYKVRRPKGRPTYFDGVSLRPEPAAPPRPPTAQGAPHTGGGDILAALAAIAPLVADTRDLDRAHLRLTGASGRLCRRCGTLTGRPDMLHVACAKEDR